MSELMLDWRSAEADAKAEGFEVIVGDDHTLLFDFDLPDKKLGLKMADAPHQFYKGLDLLSAIFGGTVEEVDRWNSKSGGLHLVMKMKVPLPFHDRLLIQACLGSDPVRELLSWIGKQITGDSVSMLFKPGERK